MFKQAQNLYLKAGVMAGMALASVGAMAQATDPLGDILDAVDLGSVSTKVVALALLVVGIAIVFKGPDLAKRIIRKV